mmetsp:Transcript_25760/g.25044  ORF Transcript_25760/g.25044 Transcript_25760/m.25044 type:complete len:231 (-) Transcript_25760:555-1247(-)
MGVFGLEGVLGVLEVIVQDAQLVQLALLQQPVDGEDVGGGLSVDPGDLHEVEGVLVLSVVELEDHPAGVVDELEGVHGALDRLRALLEPGEQLLEDGAHVELEVDLLELPLLLVHLLVPDVRQGLLLLEELPLQEVDRGLELVDHVQEQLEVVGDLALLLVQVQHELVVQQLEEVLDLLQRAQIGLVRGVRTLDVGLQPPRVLCGEDRHYDLELLDGVVGLAVEVDDAGV